MGRFLVRAAPVALAAGLLAGTVGCGSDAPSSAPTTTAGTRPGTTAGTTPGNAPGTTPGTTPGTAGTTAPVTTTAVPSTTSTAAAVPTTAVAPTTSARPASTNGPTTATTATRSFTGVPAGVEVGVVAQDLDAPWDVAFTPDGTAWVSERNTGVVKAIGADGRSRDALRLPSVRNGEGGLLGLAVSPSWSVDRTLFAYYTTADDNRVAGVNTDTGAVRPILTGIPAAANHDGGRLAFGPDGKLYVGTGDAGDGDRAQDTGSLAGKILRIEPNGSVPAGNPFGNAVWSYGHRNVEGLAWDAAGRMYATEFGPDVNDEINLIAPGQNYGWPEVTGTTGRFTDPLLVLQPGEASPSGLTFVTGDSAWAGSLLFGALRGARVYRATLDGAAITGTEQLFAGSFGRVRLVTQAPDGSIWLLTNNRDGRGSARPGDDLVVRIAPPG